MTPEEACRKYRDAEDLGKIGLDIETLGRMGWSFKEKTEDTKPKWEPELHWKHDAIRFFAIVGPLFVLSFTVGYFGSEILNAMDLQWFDVGLK